MSYVTTSSISIFINGKPSQFFEPTRGIRQGDPISPYLFIICMERLSRIIEETVTLKAWTTVSITHKGPKISHLFFTDDLALFAQANHQNCRTINSVLQKFSILSGQKINHEKSRVNFSNNSSAPNVRECSNILNIKSSENFGKYLGFPIFNQRPNNANFQFILDNMNKKLAGWKTHMLNMVGRCVLEKSFLSSIPSYVM